MAQVRRLRHVASVAGVVALTMVLLAGCVEKVTVAGNGSASGAPTGTAPDGSTVDRNNTSVMGGTDAGAPPVTQRYAGRKLSFGTVPDAPKKAGPGAPIKIGMINQENTPLGSFPELRLGAQAAITLINEELGGVDGRPLELVPCITTFSVEKSQACAQDLVQQEVAVVTGGIDITSSGSMPVLQQNDMPYIGGIPVNMDDMESPISFQFSGGSPGAMVGFAKHAADAGAKRVAVVYAEYPPMKVAAVDYGVATLKKLGVAEVDEVPFNLMATDYLPILTKANENTPDAIFLAAADTACEPAIRMAHQLGIEAQLYLVGACAAPSIAEKVGPEAMEGLIFNIESNTAPDDVEAEIYFSAVAKYGDPKLPGASAATIAFRDIMNIYGLMQEIGADAVSPATMLAKVRQARDRPSFNGYPYTCDGKQIEALPALCAAQQILAQRQGDQLVPLGTWIDVPAIVRSGG